MSGRFSQSENLLSKVNCSTRGFTVIELLVTFSIYVIISTVVIANYREYSTNAVSANAPEDIVLALRQAQVYGAGGKGCGASFDCRYGVVFTTTPGSENGFTIYTDSNDNKVYDIPATEKIETIKWKDPSIITKVECLSYIGGDTTCSSNILNITFKRPSPDALINDTADMTGLTSGGYERGRITVSNGIIGAGAKTRTITISQAGQMSVQ